MPQRPESHQLEDKSRKALERLLPPAWVIRKKDADYGLDLEVEIFDEKGGATGLVFYVQLKATKTAKKARHVTLDVDHLDYLNSFTLPTLIARYCEETDSFFVKWHFLKKLSRQEEAQKTITFHFDEDDQWSEETPSRLETCVRQLKWVRDLRPNDRFPLRPTAVGLGPNELYALDVVLARIKDGARELSLCSAQSPPSDFEIELIAAPDGVRVGIGELMSFTTPDVYADPDKLFSYVMHSLIALLSRQNAAAQAQRLLSWMVKDKIVCPSKPLAVLVMQSIAAAPELLVEFGLLNDLCDPTEPEYGVATAYIIGAAHTYGGSPAIEDWYGTAMARARASGCDTTLAAVHYSRANGLMNAGRLEDAAQFYNQARKCDQDYIRRKYYLMEFGGVLYLLRRFRMSAKLYQLGAAIEPSATDLLRYGDALMFSGEIEEAKQVYDQAHAMGGADSVQFEALLKRQVCEALINEYGDTCPRYTSQLEEVDLGSGELTTEAKTILERNLKDVDALDAMSNFNLALSASKEDDYVEALIRFLIVAFQSNEDVEAWANALICAFKAGVEPMLMVMIVSRSFAGHTPYQRFRAQLLSAGPSDKDQAAIGLMDAIFRELEHPHKPSKGFFDYVKQVQSELPDQSSGRDGVRDDKPD